MEEPQETRVDGRLTIRSESCREVRLKGFRDSAPHCAGAQDD